MKLLIGFGIVAAGAVALGTPATAQKRQSNALVAAVTACRAEPDDAARLRCFDTASAALAEAETSGKVVVVDREDVRKTRRSLFGFSLPKLPFFSGDDSAESQQDELTATIADAGSLGYDKYRIRLEDGAIWETTEGSPNVRGPRRGDTVLIKRGPLGSYMMKIAGQRALRAKRVG